MVQQHDELLQWVIIDPRQPRTYEQADEMLQTSRCMGIKIHQKSIAIPSASLARRSSRLQPNARPWFSLTAARPTACRKISSRLPTHIPR